MALNMPAPRMLLPSTGAWLYALYEENLGLLERLLGSQTQRSSMLRAVGADGVELLVRVFERHRYTSMLGLSYRFASTQSALEPYAYVRVYHDALLAEATHYRDGPPLAVLREPSLRFAQVERQRFEINHFLNRWLRYLLEQGHRPDGFTAADALHWRLPEFHELADADER